MYKDLGSRTESFADITIQYNYDSKLKLTAEQYESWMQAIVDRDPKENLSITQCYLFRSFLHKIHIYTLMTRGSGVYFTRSLSLFGSTLQELNHISSKDKSNTSTDSEGLT
ncbi:hypothetical protein NQ318_001568 [Aromia moschata]|uniref:Uncharacterized protein n=1 Tax=Aromia moschata TaxID=1265417 RepID=A0AAV8XAI9_9CUCU|nr:hypothetical protein NQ318_001568 [Aromia moschata]